MNIENKVERVSAHSPMQKLLFAALFSISLVGALVLLAEPLDFRGGIERLGWFKIDEVSVESSWPLSTAEVRSWLPVLQGHSLLALDVNPLFRDLLEKPWVKGVSIRKKYPSTLLVSVETKKAAAISRKGDQLYYVDSEGSFIHRVTPTLAKELDLPVVSIQRQAALVKWELAEGTKLLSQISEGLGSQYKLSELVMETYPYFKVYLSRPRVEVLFSDKTWNAQLPRLRRLLDSPPSQIRQMARINLVFPKKAIVSSPLSN
ncbi:MAG: FtsQ-type POTRA domain-containing protein [Bdellovibrionaceae bacterium]|nr:FtsQ-type POTRA domain-containing protein [Bdellovibrionales bacterium]MCB9253910.1 FtsQ-type POTRA domain-containing protein [Pseudobdellovibrionaceae bacterium]